MTFDEYFPVRYLITLKDNTKRHVHVKKELDKAGIEITEMLFSKKYIFKSCFKNTAQRSMTEAHMNIHRLAKNSPNSNVVALEDDICFVDNFKERIKPIIADLQKEDWDFFFFFKPEKGTSDLDGDRGEVIKRYDSGLLKITGTINTHSYAVNSKSVDKIVGKYNLDYISKLPLQIRTIDKSIASLRMNFFACDENLIYQSERFPSSTRNANPNASLIENIKLYFKPVGND